MPTLLQSASELNKVLSVGWNGETDIAIDNVPYTETQGQAYIETVFMPYNTENVLVGAAVQKRKRTPGVLSIIIRTPLEIGTGLAYTYASSIGDIMDNKTILPDLFTYASTTRRVGDSIDGWFSLICDVPFTSDET